MAGFRNPRRLKSGKKGNSGWKDGSEIVYHSGKPHVKADMAVSVDRISDQLRTPFTGQC